MSHRFYFHFSYRCRFRYTLRELPKILADLKKRADSFDNWELAVHKALTKSDAAKIGMFDLFSISLDLSSIFKFNFRLNSKGAFQDLFGN